ncbi:MAG: hypothetical protein H6581_08580 [Bacteroidia bacterium]|nr:hypothetical protein [Bacteroidia bacterium]
MNAVLIQRNLQISEEKTLLARERASETLFLGTLGQISQENLGENVRLLALEKDEIAAISTRIFRQVINFGGKQFSGKSLFEHLRIGVADVWNHSKFNVFYALRDLSYQKAEILFLLEKFSKVEVFTSNPLLEEYFGKDENVVFRFPAANPPKPGFQIAVVFKYVLKTIFRSFLGLFYLSRIRNVKHLIIQRPANLARTKDGHWTNPFLGGLVKKADQDFGILDDNPPPPFRKKGPKNDGKPLFSRENQLPVLFSDYVILKGLLSSSIRRKVNDSLKSLRKTLNELEKQANSWEENAIISILRKELYPEKIYLIKYHSFVKYLQKLKNLRTIAASGENSGQTKAILDAALACGMQRIGIQHGTIHEEHPAYCFTPLETQLGATPDYTLVWGTHWASQLAQIGNYKPASLVLCGQPRTDSIMSYRDNLLKSRSFSEKNPKPIILFAAQNIPDVGLNHRIVRILFQTMKEFPDLQLVIKLHPRDPQTDFFDPFAAETGFSDYSIVQKEDLYHLLSQCSALITYSSTVGVETVYFQKKLFIIDPLGSDFMGYQKEGVADLSRTQEEFHAQMQAAVKNNFAVDEVRYSQFIRKYSYLTDGKVAERAISFIKSL